MYGFLRIVNHRTKLKLEIRSRVYKQSFIKVNGLNVDSKINTPNC